MVTCQQTDLNHFLSTISLQTKTLLFSIAPGAYVQFRDWKFSTKGLPPKSTKKVKAQTL